MSGEHMSVGISVELIGITLMLLHIFTGAPAVLSTIGIALWLIGFVIWVVEQYA